MSKPRVLMIDNFDSFTFNLVDALESAGAEVGVYRNDISAMDAIAIAEKNKVSMIVISPGPGRPEDAGCSVELMKKAAGRFPVFGICLGHQAMASAFGGKIGSAGDIVHGKKSRVTRRMNHPLFEGLPETFEAGRYHSLTVTKAPEAFNVIAESEGLIMAIAHKTLPLFGTQFHPESILTTQGQRMIENALNYSLNY